MNLLLEHEAQYIKDKNTSHRMVSTFPNCNRVYRFFSHKIVLKTVFWNDDWVARVDKEWKNEKVQSRKTYKWLI